MELLHPLMHDCGWAHDDCGPQSSIPAQMRMKPSEIFTRQRDHFCGYEYFDKYATYVQRVDDNNTVNNNMDWSNEHTLGDN